MAIPIGEYKAIAFAAFGVQFLIARDEKLGKLLLSKWGVQWFTFTSKISKALDSLLKTMCLEAWF